MGVIKETHNEYVNRISEYLQKTQDSYIVINDFEYTSSSGKPGQVDILLLSRKNMNAVFLEFKSRDSDGEYIKAWEGYNKFRDTYESRLTFGLYVTPNKVQSIENNNSSQFSDLEKEVETFLIQQNN